MIFGTSPDFPIIDFIHIFCSKIYVFVATFLCITAQFSFLNIPHNNVHYLTNHLILSPQFQCRTLFFKCLTSSSKSLSTKRHHCSIYVIHLYFNCHHHQFSFIIIVLFSVPCNYLIWEKTYYLIYSSYHTIIHPK